MEKLIKQQYSDSTQPRTESFQSILIPAYPRFFEKIYNNRRNVYGK